MRINRSLIAMGLLAAASGLDLAHAQTLTTLYSFCSKPGKDGRCLDGSFQVEGFLQGTDGNFYGVTYAGGTSAEGTVFKITPGGELTTLYSFTNFDGGYPDSLIQGTDGNFYGTTAGYEGISGSSVFKITPGGALTTLWNFGDHMPAVGLFQGGGSNFFGATYANVGACCPYRVNPAGTFFSISPDGVFTNLSSFADGSAVNALVPAIDGSYYGTTIGYWEFHDPGCYSANGTIFALSPTGTITALVEFTGRNGSMPNGLVQYSDGSFYGTTEFGGPQFYYTCRDNAGKGTIFKVTSGGVLTNLYNFTGGSNGANPAGGLIVGTDGNFYGLTTSGGTLGGGTVFQFTTNGILRTLAAFATNSAPGAMIQAVDGDFYGVTSSGGKFIGNGQDIFQHGGTVFKLAVGLTCVFSISPTNTRFESTGDVGRLTVGGNRTNCVWTADSNDPFITITEGTSGSGTGTVRYAVAANTTTVNRTGTITVAGQTVTISQAAAPNLAVLAIKAPTTIHLRAGGPALTQTVTVQIQNLSARTEIINDLATLADLVTVQLTNRASSCASPTARLVMGPPNVVPRTIKPKGKLNVVFRVTFSPACVPDPLGGVGHADFSYTAVVNAAALEGNVDAVPANDTCPRPPNPAIGDKGCGNLNPVTKQLGAAVVTDLVVK